MYKNMYMYMCLHTWKYIVRIWLSQFASFLCGGQGCNLAAECPRKMRPRQSVSQLLTCVNHWHAADGDECSSPKKGRKERANLGWAILRYETLTLGMLSVKITSKYAVEPHQNRIVMMQFKRNSKTYCHSFQRAIRKQYYCIVVCWYMYVWTIFSHYFSQHAKS